MANGVQFIYLFFEICWTYQNPICFVVGIGYFELHGLEPVYSVEIFNREVRLSLRLFLNLQRFCLVDSRTVCTYIKGYDLPCGP